MASTEGVAPAPVCGWFSGSGLNGIVPRAVRAVDEMPSFW
jgi:hypothetical protein